jgi:hypothetical protein
LYDLCVVEAQNWLYFCTFSKKLTESLRYFYCVGGMPESVNIFMATKDVRQVREFQKKLLDAYERDFSKYALPEMVPRIPLK